ncbi:C-type lectin domain-containing protein [Caenorhabditis elegans]|uniref:C-type lectin domain-containing protein n=1 Tax=Caenorhabditis elegans TaxID=6239 RepID=O45534_CAEEL|nr:C-type lectin domain-containing protein [Caenorhabditis elegans]CAB04419.4 C-type lectin domain-containing protein [Caenorhabditis elegans]|eukprot:NP_507262.2 C-type LECtin [Caenorhabditis elegans]
MSASHLVPEKWIQFLRLHWLIILIGVITEIVIITGVVLLTYFTTHHAACAADKITSSDFQRSNVFSLTSDSTNSEALSSSTTNIPMTTFSTNEASSSTKLLSTSSTAEISSTTRTVSRSIKPETSTASTTIRPLTTTTTPAPSNNVGCTFGFNYINGKCWRLVTSLQTRDNADFDCMREGGSTLFSIRNEQENNATLDFVSNSGVAYIWTGLICNANTSSSCTWDLKSGSAANYDNFAKGFPNKTIGDCVYFIANGTEAGHWKSSACNQTMSYVCELPPTIHDDNCDNNYNNNCYVRYDKSSTIADAQEFCKTKHGGNLVSINSANENRYVQTLYYVSGYIPLGAVVPNYNVIYWMDGSPATYNNILYYTNGTCLFLNFSWGGSGDFWETVECTDKSWFLCKWPIGIDYAQ